MNSNEYSVVFRKCQVPAKNINHQDLPLRSMSSGSAISAAAVDEFWFSHRREVQDCVSIFFGVISKALKGTLMGAAIR
jgi:hypothetical protein